MKSIAELYPNGPHEVAADYAQIDQDFKRDPINSDSGCCRKEPDSPLEIARQVAMAHSPQQIQQFHAQREAEVVVGAFLAAYPDVDQEAAITALGKFPRSGNMARRHGEATRWPVVDRRGR